MEWMVVSCVRMTREDHNAYALGFRKSFEKCKRDHQEFEFGKSLLGVVIDCSDTEMWGLWDAVGTGMARTLLKGCQVHWNCSWQQVRDRIVLSKEKTFEKSILRKSLIILTHWNLESMYVIVLKSYVMNKKQTLIGIIKGLQLNEAQFVDNKCDWSAAKNWAQWWMRSNHLAMLHKVTPPCCT